MINKYIISSTATCIHSDTLHEQGERRDRQRDEIKQEKKKKAEKSYRREKERNGISRNKRKSSNLFRSVTTHIHTRGKFDIVKGVIGIRQCTDSRRAKLLRTRGYPRGRGELGNCTHALNHTDDSTSWNSDVTPRLRIWQQHIKPSWERRTAEPVIAIGWKRRYDNK